MERHLLAKRLQGRMVLHVGPFVIIESRPAQPLVAPLKTQWVNQMQLRPGIGTEPNDITRIGRDLRLVEDEV